MTGRRRVGRRGRLRHRAVIAALPMAIAAGLLAAAPAAATPTPATPSAVAPSPARHVAVVVAGARSACVPWRAGMTGADVLSAAGFDVGYGQRAPYVGFVLRIDGKGTDQPDDEHYWSYWREDDGGWVYSSTGAPWTKSAPGTVEGWSYVDGQAHAAPPPATGFASVCTAGSANATPGPPASPAAGPTGAPTWGAALGIAGVAVLAGGAFWLYRIRNRSDP